jgi:excisionase family DNA binding protein
MTDLPLAEAARYLGLSVAQTRRKVNAGELPSHRDARGRIIVELTTATGPRTPAQDPTVREVVQLRVEVGLLREERESFSGRMEYSRKHIDELVEHVRELTRQLAVKDELIAELARRLGG